MRPHHRTLEIRNAIDSHAYRRTTRPLWNKSNDGFLFQQPIDKTAIGLAVIGLSHDIPPPERMRLGLIDQRRLISWPVREGLEIAPVAIHPQLKGKPRILIAYWIIRIDSRV